MENYEEMLLPGIHADRQAIRLLKAVTVFAPGGTEGQVHNFVRTMDHSRFDLRFACLKKWGCYLKELEERQIPVEEYRIKSLYKPDTLRLQLRLAAHLRQERIQIVHSYNFYSNMFAIPAARLAGVPVVIASVRDQGVYMTAAQKLAQRWVCRLADKVLVNADSIRDWLAGEGFPRDRVLTIRNGIDLRPFEAAAGASSIRREYGIAADAPLVVMLSRLNPKKGIDDYFKAAVEVSRRHPAARFLMVGEKLTAKGPDMEYKAELQRLSSSLGLDGKLIFTGHRNDVPQLLAETDVSVLPSHSEGISNSLLESMAAGVPVVATRVGGIPELVEDGVTGFLVPPREPRQLAGAINRILDDRHLHDSFSRAARRRVRERFSLERMVRDTESLYLELLKEKTGAAREARAPEKQTIHRDRT